MVVSAYAQKIDGSILDPAENVQISEFEVYNGIEQVEEPLDVSAPETTHEIIGTTKNGWYRDMVTLKFIAKDSESGIDATYFSVNNGDVHSGSSVDINEEGKHLINYWSKDEVGLSLIHI